VLLGLRDATCARAALTAWMLCAVLMCLFVARSVERDPTDDVANDAYVRASEAWWARESLYRPFDGRGFFYLPHAAIAFTPLADGELVARHVTTRAVFLALFVAGLACLAGVGDRRRRGARFGILTIACLPLAIQNVRQGQMNLPMVGAMLMGTAALATGRRGWAALAFVAAVLIKPIALPLVLLVGACWPRTLGPRLLAGLAAAFALPFLAGPPGYVWAQYGDFVEKVLLATDPPTMYYDLRGLLVTGLGLELSPGRLTAIRAAAALGVLALCLGLVRRRGTAEGALLVHVLAACYLTLFSPKTEDPTYLVLGPAIGLAAVAAWKPGRSLLEPALLLLLFPGPIAASWELHGGRAYWFRPALAALFTAYVLARLRGPKAPVEPEGVQPRRIAREPAPSPG
jgi:hypothetical protein